MLIRTYGVERGEGGQASRGIAGTKVSARPELRVHLLLCMEHPKSSINEHLLRFSDLMSPTNPDPHVYESYNTSQVVGCTCQSHPSNFPVPVDPRHLCVQLRLLFPCTAAEG